MNQSTFSQNLFEQAKVNNEQNIKNSVMLPIQVRQRLYQFENRLPISIKTVNNFFTNKKFRHRISQLDDNQHKNRTERISVNELKQKMISAERNYNRKLSIKCAINNQFKNIEKVECTRKINTERQSPCLSINQLFIRKQPLRFHTQNISLFPLCIKARDKYDKYIKEDHKTFRRSFFVKKQANSLQKNTQKRSYTSHAKFNLTEVSIENPRGSQAVSPKCSNKHKQQISENKNSSATSMKNRLGIAVFREKKKSISVKHKKMKIKNCGRQKSQNKVQTHMMKQQENIKGWETKTQSFLGSDQITMMQ